MASHNCVNLCDRMLYREERLSYDRRRSFRLLRRKMAQRRMFSKTITNSSRFLRMPASSRLLYYDLGMMADDDGYVEWYAVITMTKSSEQDIQVLNVNEFVKVFDDKVLIVKDWKENNYIRPDRYSPSKYLNTYKMTEVGIPNINQTLTTGIPMVDPGKDRVGKDKKEDTFVQFWNVYPKKKDKQSAIKSWNRINPNKELLLTIISAVTKQAKSEQWTRDGGQFIPLPSTWLNGARWEDEETKVYKKTIEDEAEERGIPIYSVED